MGLSIMNNTASLIAQDNLNNTQSMLNTSLERLSTGYQLNTGADGPAAYVISQEQLNQIAGLQTAITNTSQAVSMVQTAEGALGTISNLLTQVRSLALSSANTGANDSNALAANQAQIANALGTINDIAANTQFENKPILNGAAGIAGTTSDPANLTFVTANANSPTGSFTVNVTGAATRASVTAGSVQGTNTLAGNETLTINGVAIQLDQGETQTQVVNSINQYTNQTGVVAQTIGSGQTAQTQLYSQQFGSAAAIQVQSDVAGAATSSGFGVTQQNASGTDIAGTIGGFAATGNGNILTGNAGTGAAGISVAAGLASGSEISTVGGSGANAYSATVTTANDALVFQIGANANQTTSVAVSNVAADALGLNVAGNEFSSLQNINVQSQSGAQAAIGIIDAASSQVANLDAQLGATQTDTLTQNQNNLQTALQNTTSAESTIRDTDFAAETANYTQDQVLMQVGTTVLQNANQNSQLILDLIKNM